MMKKIVFRTMLFLLVFFQAGNSLKAQYTLVSFEPPLSFTHLDLWNLVITGPVDSNTMEYYLRLRVFDDQNQLLVKSQSSTFHITNATTQFNITNLSTIQPIVVSYTSDYTFQTIVNTGGFFPPGNYHIVFTLLGRPQDGEYTELAEYNYPHTSESLWPPMLISVENEDTICEQYPVFTWIPAFQQVGSSPLTYNFKMVEVNAYQSPYQAITANPYYYAQQDIPITLLNYPVSASQLIYGQQYAWQVDAIINSQVASSSEIWTFVYGCPGDTLIDTIPKLPYVKLRNEANGGVTDLINKYLYVEYEERYSPPAGSYLNFKVYNTITNELMPDQHIELDIIEGSNYYIISTCGDGLDLPDGSYRFETQDQKGNIWYMQFNKNQIDCQ